MAQSLARLWTHLIFSTKEPYPFLSDPNVRADMHGYLARVLHTHDCATRVVGGCDDHVHALFTLSRNSSIAQIVKEIKRTSSAWIKTVERRYSKFHWQAGYGAFSVSQSHVSQVQRYIMRQEQHHKRRTFQDVPHVFEEVRNRIRRALRLGLTARMTRHNAEGVRKFQPRATP